MSTARKQLASTYSSTRGYFAGGYGPVTEIDGLDFTNETAINPSAVLAVGRYDFAGVQSATRGYFGGGSNGMNYQSEIDGIRFDTEAAVNPSAVLSTARRGNASASSTSKGYWAGGDNGPKLSVIDSIQFDTEAVATCSTTLTVARNYLSGTQSLLCGYFAGGDTTVRVTEIDGIVFNSDTSKNPSAVLNTASDNLGATSSTSKGYWAGGTTSGGFSNFIFGIDFTTEAIANPTITLTVARTSLAGVSNTIWPTNSGNRGYWCGGQTSSSNPTTIDGIDYSTDAALVVASQLSQYAIRLASLSSSTSGYATDTNRTQKLTFSTETVSYSDSLLSVTRNFSSGVQSADRGYFGCGMYYSTYYSEVDGIIFATDAKINPSAALSVGRGSVDSVSSSAKGYWKGGNIPTTPYINNLVDGLNFNTETTFTTSVTLSVLRYECASAQSATRGYFAGGSGNSGDGTRVDGIEFVTEAAFNLGTLLTVSRYKAAGCSSLAKGYIAGGEYKDIAGYTSEIDGVDFVTNTGINPAATLSLARSRMSAFSNIVPPTLTGGRGYFCGGDFLGTNEIDGINFSSEAVINPAATLSRYRGYSSGVYSSAKGYIMGDNQNNPVNTSIDGFTFATETDAVITATMPVGRFGGCGLQSATKGYTCGGSDQSNLSGVVYALVFATEVMESPSANIGQLEFTTGISEVYKGYIMNGVDTSWAPTQGIKQLDFATQTVITLSATNNVTRSSCAGTHSSTKGYVAGGTTIAGGSNITSDLDGFIFATATSTNPTCTLVTPRKSLTGVQSSIRGYYAGGDTLAGNSLESVQIDGIEFATETSINPSSNLTVRRKGLTGLTYADS